MCKQGIALDNRSVAHEQYGTNSVLVPAPTHGLEEMGCEWVFDGLGVADRSDARICVTLVVNRSGSRDLTEVARLTAVALYPHIHNLSSAVLSPVEFRAHELGRTFQEAGLTLREREVALLLCDRLSVAEISERLFISRKTAAKHLEHIYLKLGLHGKRSVYEQLLGERPGFAHAPKSLREIRAPFEL